MCRSKRVIWPFALCLLFSLAISARPCRAEENYVITGSELQRLNEMQTKLDELNQKLNSDLVLSLENLRKLESELQACKAELDTWKAALDESQMRLQSSEAELAALKERWQTAQASYDKALKSLEESLRAALSQIRRLRIQRNLAILGAILALCL
jgi:septal ring factor EnvC (AmiA/AmiB activator)